MMSFPLLPFFGQKVDEYTKMICYEILPTIGCDYMANDILSGLRRSDKEWNQLQRYRSEKGCKRLKEERRWTETRDLKERERERDVVDHDTIQFQSKQLMNQSYVVKWGMRVSECGPRELLEGWSE